jgi:CheY-like chemotaxis protein
MTTILHVEDDPSLAEMVQLSFEALGFSNTLIAPTVKDAMTVIADVARHPSLDLIITRHEPPRWLRAGRRARRAHERREGPRARPDPVGGRRRRRRSAT